MTKGRPFEKSKRDIEPRGMVEGSRKEEAFDRRQGGAIAKGYAKGGPVLNTKSYSKKIR